MAFFACYIAFGFLNIFVGGWGQVIVSPARTQDHSLATVYQPEVLGLVGPEFCCAYNRHLQFVLIYGAKIMFFSESERKENENLK